MAKQLSTENMKAAHPVDAELFGAMGAAAAHICQDLSKSFIGKRFEFMDLTEYEGIGDPAEMGRVYWREILFRVYWAAALNIMRHQRWQIGCVRAFSYPPNLLAFAASLRGLLEGAQDAYYSLSPVVNLLAENRTRIESALRGTAKEFGICQELEDRLIHFVYGRKVGKGERETTPNSHIALEPRDYRNALGLPADKRDSFRELYDDLCGFCHPTAFSLACLWERQDAWIQINEGSDEAFIKELCQHHQEVISLTLSLSVTMSALCLKALNWFPLAETKCEQIERWDFDDIKAWRKARAKADKGLVH